MITASSIKVHNKQTKGNETIDYAYSDDTVFDHIGYGRSYPLFNDNKETFEQ